jgi:hypothetical protein
VGDPIEFMEEAEPKLLKLFFISGLGADERAFEKLLIPEGYEVKHIPWKPLAGNTTIKAIRVCWQKK